MSSDLTPRPPTADELLKNLSIDKHDDHSILDLTSPFWRDNKALKQVKKGEDLHKAPQLQLPHNHKFETSEDIDKTLQLQELYNHQKRDMQARIMSDLQYLDTPDKIEQKKLYMEKLWENMQQALENLPYNKMNKIVNSIIHALDKQIGIYGRKIKKFNPNNPNANEKKYNALQACRAKLEEVLLEKSDELPGMRSKYKKFFSALEQIDTEVKDLPSNNPLKRLVNWVLEKTGREKIFDTGAQKILKEIKRVEKKEIYPMFLKFPEKEGETKKTTSADKKPFKPFKPFKKSN